MPRQVKIIIPTGLIYETMVAAGICQAIKSRPTWIVRLHYPGGDWLKCVHDWNPDAVVIGAPERPDIFAQIKVPIVRISSSYEQSNHPSVLSDDPAVGRMGAEYLLNLNLKYFAFIGQNIGLYARRRWNGFFEALTEASIDKKNIHIFEDKDMEQRQRDREIRKWLKKLPKPIGLLAGGGEWLYYLNDIARDAGIDIPNEIALLGVGNEELLCELARPPLSSISLATGRIGHEVVRVLDEMLTGQPAPSQPVLIPPVGVVSRGSTNMLAVDDPDVARAIRFIREHATEDIGVADLLKQIPISRSGLEAKFKFYFNRSPGAEIRRLRLEKARQMLAHGDSSVHEVARRSGFNSPEYLAKVFLREMGMSPSAYKQKVAGTVD